jgi:hypothetical protein
MDPARRYGVRRNFRRARYHDGDFRGHWRGDFHVLGFTRVTGRPETVQPEPRVPPCKFLT